MSINQREDYPEMLREHARFHKPILTQGRRNELAEEFLKFGIPAKKSGGLVSGIAAAYEAHKAVHEDEDDIRRIESDGDLISNDFSINLGMLDKGGFRVFKPLEASIKHSMEAIKSMRKRIEKRIDSTDKCLLPEDQGH